MIFPYTLAPSVTAAELTRITGFFYDFVTDRPDRIPKLSAYLMGILAIDETGTAVALEQQRRGDLAKRVGGRWAIGSPMILRGAAIGGFATDAPDHFLSGRPEYWADVQGPARQTLSRVLFAAKLVLDDSIKARGDTDLELRQLARIVGTACQQEVLDRLARHPTSAAVYGWLKEDPTAIASLLTRVRQHARSVCHRPNQRFLRGRGTGARPYDDEREALLQYVTAITVPKSVAAKIRRWYPNGALGSPALLLAMDGRLGNLPNEAKNALIDHYRGESAQKRGGGVTSYATIDNQGDVELRRDEEGRSRSAAWGADITGMYQPQGSVVEHATRAVWAQAIEAIERNRPTDAPTVRRARETLGPAVSLLKFYSDHDDAADWTDVAIAHKLGVNERTIRRHRASLRLNRAETVLLRKTYDQ